jgi:hypothetical protein
MQLIVDMRFGAHLYGTATASSDLDLKGVYLPAARDILLQQVRPSISLGRDKATGERNQPGDVDRDLYSLQRYLDLLSHGQTVALDMLFAPDSALTQPPHSIWREIQANRHRLVSRRSAAFVQYCRQQAHKFGIKGSRVAAARQALAILVDAEQRLGSTAKLAQATEDLAALVVDVEHVDWVELPSPAGPDGASKMIRNLAICGRKVPLTASLKTAREIAQRLVDDYGERALAAERNDGVDWKALSHAVRVGQEALELFRTHRITFPLASAAHLIAIKMGAVPYAEVAAEIEALLTEIDQAAATSTLPAEPDQDFIDDLIARHHRAVVLAGSAK